MAYKYGELDEAGIPREEYQLNKTQIPTDRLA